MNTMARYLRALGLTVDTPVTEIKFGEVTYTFDTSSSAWKKGEDTLVSAVVEAQNSAIQNVTFTLVDADGYSVDVNFIATGVDINLDSYGYEEITIIE